ncbi:u3 small nucleolar ribonucleoprotein protein IMP4 [Trichonephila clavata]|uniref:U3 small nucleolar ribonucleoprotein protein IMP4 n=1 Tax=Trichonephila clavata TaxID=2740835 RepID=A0A8X6L2S3_TRICU|nr:u3 small nucleolar ribonucleoprotein protein IMP4 [Trichonephila clavata]
MFARQAKLRREFITGKMREHKEKAKIEKKKQVKKALTENKMLPTTVQKDALKIQESLEWDDVPQNETSEIDDEYRYALVEDPKIVITTSRDPSVKLKQFAKELRLIFPNSQRLNRGNYNFKTLMEACKANGVTDFILLEETRGEPDGITICHLPFGPTARFSISDTVLRHDIPNIGAMPQEFPHLAFYNFKSKLGNRVVSILKHLFPVPKEESKRLVAFLNCDDWILFRHHTHFNDERGEIQLVELGPRFVLKLYAIKRGTIDEYYRSDVEWALHQFTNTARKRTFLSSDPLFE